jgi:hypothetical protein
MMRKHKLAMFRHNWAHYMGAKLSSKYTISNASRCLGVLESLQTVPAAEAAPRLLSGIPVDGWVWEEGFYVSGWAWDFESNKPPALILIADDEGIICGIAKPTFKRADVLESRGIKSDREPGWAGFAKGKENGTLYAYALASDESTVYPLSGMRISDRKD